jgi:hypothetical protein
MDRGSINSFQINERLVGAGRFERPTPCAQGNMAMLISRAITSNAINELSRNRLQSKNSYVVIFVAGHSSGFNILHHRTTFGLQ